MNIINKTNQLLSESYDQVGEQSTQQLEYGVDYEVSDGTLSGGLNLYLVTFKNTQSFDEYSPDHLTRTLVQATSSDMAMEISDSFNLKRWSHLGNKVKPSDMAVKINPLDLDGDELFYCSVVTKKNGNLENSELARLLDHVAYSRRGSEKWLRDNTILIRASSRNDAQKKVLDIVGSNIDDMHRPIVMSVKDSGNFYMLKQK